MSKRKTLFVVVDVFPYSLTGSKLFARNTGQNGWIGQKDKGKKGKKEKGTMGQWDKGPKGQRDIRFSV